MSPIILASFTKELFGGFIVFLIVLIVVFLIFRELVCWYWKINERIDLQKRQTALLEKLVNPSGNSNSGTEKRGIPAGKKCQSCNWENGTDDMFCANCGKKLS